ncbi:MAG: sensor histidine kinase, partial [Calditrichia bacterium]|nr:sensor histidine kinase [Calditrichia bacterium]
NNDGVWNEEGTSIDITITQPWWQTWWFRALLAISFIGLLILAYNYRVSHFRKITASQKEFSRKLIESQEKERKRIASALHDSHGQNLLIISNEMQQYVNKHKDSEKELKNVTETVQESINEIREISYDLHPHQLERMGLNNAIDSMISKVSKSSEIQFDLVMDDIKKLFDKKVEINLYRIIQEAVNNIIKHSLATEAKVEIKKNIKYVVISISDNGKGFDKKKMLQKVNGLGLIGMQERVKLINGSFKIKSEPNNGTNVVMHIPIKYNPKL